MFLLMFFRDVLTWAQFIPSSGDYDGCVCDLREFSLDVSCGSWLNTAIDTRDGLRIERQECVSSRLCLPFLLMAACSSFHCLPFSCGMKFHRGVLQNTNSWCFRCLVSFEMSCSKLSGSCLTCSEVFDFRYQLECSGRRLSTAKVSLDRIGEYLSGVSLSFHQSAFSFMFFLLTKCIGRAIRSSSSKRIRNFRDRPH